MRHQLVALTALTVLFGTVAHALPKYETSDKALAKGDFYHEGADQVAMESETTPNVTEGVTEGVAEKKDRPPRFGFPPYTQDVQTVSNVSPGLYGPVKLDIGGLVLGTIVGLGAFFILPKLFHVVSTPYGGYKRSEDKSGDSFLAQLFSRIQGDLGAYDIDSAACLQRAVCASVQSASEKAGNKTANSLEIAVDNVVRNDMMKAVIEGTEWKKAVDVAERGENCNAAFPKCSMEVDAVASAIAKYLLS